MSSWQTLGSIPEMVKHWLVLNIERSTKLNSVWFSWHPRGWNQANLAVARHWFWKSSRSRHRSRGPQYLKYQGGNIRQVFPPEFSRVLRLKHFKFHAILDLQFARAFEWRQSKSCVVVMTFNAKTLSIATQRGLGTRCWIFLGAIMAFKRQLWMPRRCMGLTYFIQIVLRL